MAAVRVRLEFIHTPLFEASIKGLLDDEALRDVELALLQDPTAGAVVAGTGGVRKLRAALPGRGKRGGARVVYLFVALRGRIYLLLAYAKNRQADLTSTEKRVLRTLAHQLEGEV